MFALFHGDTLRSNGVPLMLVTWFGSSKFHLLSEWRAPLMWIDIQFFLIFFFMHLCVFYWEILQKEHSQFIQSFFWDWINRPILILNFRDKFTILQNKLKYCVKAFVAFVRWKICRVIKKNLRAMRIWIKIFVITRQNREMWIWSIF